MSKHIDTAALATVARITPTPTLTRVDRTFELPRGLYAATAGAYLAFVGIMAAAFRDPGLAIPLAICALFIVIGFGLAGRWASMGPENASAPLTWGQFRERGIATLTGRLTASEATVQVLILPVLILGWALAVAVIAAVVA